MVMKTGYRVIGTITNIKGICRFGHKVGQEFELSTRNSGGQLCGYLQHVAFPWILMLERGGTWFDGKRGEFPEDECPEIECPDIEDAVRIKLRRGSLWREGKGNTPGKGR